MDNLDKELHRLSKIEPSESFMNDSKKRLLHHVQRSQPDHWFRAFLKKVGVIEPSSSFVVGARARLVSQIKALPQRPLRGLTVFWQFAKKAIASTLVMTISVFSVLVVTYEKPVSASDDSYLLNFSDGDVYVQHANSNSFDKVNDQIQIQEGDLIWTKDNSPATLYFSDGTRIELDENTRFLIKTLKLSPHLDRQAIIQASLSEGRVWTQVSNVNDDAAGLTISTTDAVVTSLNASFDLRDNLIQPTEVSVFKGRVKVSQNSVGLNGPQEVVRLMSDERLVVDNRITNLPTYSESMLSEAIELDDWIQANMEKDKEHLERLKEKDYQMLEQMAGPVPGDLNYLVEQANQYLNLALSDDEQVVVDIANNHLNDAILLFKSGEVEKATKSLEAYRELSRQIAQDERFKEDSGQDDVETLTHKLVTTHEASLRTQEPADPATDLVEEAIQETAKELVENNPLKLEKLKTNQAVGTLEDVEKLLDAGEVDLAKDKLEKYGQEKAIPKDESLRDEIKKENSVIELKEDELALLESVAEEMTKKEAIKPDDEKDKKLIAMVDTASESVKKEVTEARGEVDGTEDHSDSMASATPINFDPTIPSEPVVVTKPQPEPTYRDLQFMSLVDQIYVYDSWERQINQINRLFNLEEATQTNIDFLRTISGQMPAGRAKSYLDSAIYRLQITLDAQNQPLEDASGQVEGDDLAEGETVQHPAPTEVNDAEYDENQSTNNETSESDEIR